MKKFFFLLVLGSFTSIYSQQKLSNEIRFNNDNDLYSSKEKDQYYSNGMFLDYRYISSDSSRYVKKIYEIGLGHEIYTPFKSTVISPLQHDRPFAAHLFGSFSVTKVYESGKLWTSKVLFGVVGESAMGRGLQEFIHDIYNFRAPIGWRYQIKDMLSLNLDLSYLDALGTSKSGIADINFVSNARIGTTYNDISAGFMGRLGFKKLQPIENSIAFGTNLNNDKTAFVREVESFLYYQLELGFIAYDATIQGSLFNNKSPITFNPNNLRFDAEFGYRFTANKWNFGYALHFRSNERPNLRNDRGHFFGRIFFGISF